MEKISIWKRMGGWFRRSRIPGGKSEVVHLDAESALASAGADQGKANDSSSLYVHTNKKEKQLVAMEEGFNRLVQVLESIDDNVSQQREQGSQVNERLAALAELSRLLPESVESQSKMVQGLREEIQNQGLRHQQLADTVKTLPELTQSQVDKLGEINRHMESSIETEAQMLESFNRFDHSVQGMANHTKAQAMSLANIGEMMERNEQRLQEMVRRQNRRFSWLVGIIMVGSLAAIAAVVMLVLYINK